MCEIFELCPDDRGNSGRRMEAFFGDHERGGVWKRYQRVRILWFC